VGGEERVSTFSGAPDLVVERRDVATLRPHVRSVARTTARAALCAVSGFAAIVAAAVTVPGFVGFQVFTVLSGSMHPTLATGDAIVVSRIPPLDVRIGDVVTFPSPDTPGKLITHRVVDMRASKGEVFFVTKGDANTGKERWSIPADGVLGRTVYRVPKLGYVANRAGSRVGRLALLVLPAGLLGLFELQRIWLPRRRDPVGEASL
jgi:signal peptidase